MKVRAMITQGTNRQSFSLNEVANWMIPRSKQSLQMCNGSLSQNYKLNLLLPCCFVQSTSQYVHTFIVR
jgi:hypothetical protein